MPHDHQGDPQDRGDSRLLVPTLTLIVTITGVVSSLGAPLIPSIADTFDVPLRTAQWALTAPLLVAAVLTPLTGRLTDNGHQRVLLRTCTVLVTLGTVLSAVAPGIYWLLAGRALMGLGMAMAPAAFAIGGSSVSPANRPRVLATLSVAAVVGAGLGYPISSVAAEHLGLFGAYWLGAAATGITAVMTFFIIPAARFRRHQSLDWPGATLFTLGAVALLVTIAELSHTPPVSQTAASLSIAAVSLALWVRHSLRTQSPNIDFRLALQPRVRSAHLISLIAGVGMYVYISVVVIVLQAPTGQGPGLGQSAGMTGALLVPYAIAGVAATRITVAFKRPRSQRSWLTVGCSCYLVSTSLLAWGPFTVWQVFVAMTIAGVGSGWVFSSMPGIVMGAVDSSVLGSSLAVNQVLRYTGFSVGSALAAMIIDGASRGDALLTTGGYLGALAASFTFWFGAMVAAQFIAREP